MKSHCYKLRVGYSVVEDEQSVLELQRLVWGMGEPGTSPYFRWQYLGNPLGPALTASISTASGMLAAHAACISVPIHVQGRWIVGGVVVNAATHPEHRNRGLFERVGRALLSEARKIGLSLLLSVPNELSVKVFKQKLEFHDVPKHQLMVRWIDPGAFLRQHGFKLVGAGLGAILRPFFSAQIMKPHSVRSAQMQHLEDIGPVSLDRLLCLLPGDATSTYKEWFRWRYGEHPTRRYQFVIAGSMESPSALMVYHVMMPYQKAFLGDFFFTPEASTEAIRGWAGCLANFVRRQDGCAVWCITKKRSQKELVLKRCGFMPIRLGSLSAPPILAKSLNPRFDESALSEIELSFGSLMNCD